MVDSGAPATQVDVLCGQAAAASATGSAVDPAAHGPFDRWHAAIVALSDAIRHAGAEHPGRIVSSHVHMLHNRLGLSLLDELRTYAWLAGAFPINRNSA